MLTETSTLFSPVSISGAISPHKTDYQDSAPVIIKDRRILLLRSYQYFLISLSFEKPSETIPSYRLLKRLKEPFFYLNQETF